MDAFSLRFARPQTEREYTTRLTETVLVRGDVLALSVLMVAAGLVAIRSVASRGLDGSVLVVVWLCVHFCREIQARNRLSANEITGQRTGRLVFTRIAVLIVHCWSSARQASNQTSLLLVIVGSSGLFVSLVLAFNLRLPFRFHLPCQLLYTVALLAFSTRVPCRVAMTKWETKVLVDFAHALHNGATGITAVLASQFDIVVEKPPLICPCLHTLIWAQAFVMLVLASYALWLMERRSRLDFVACLPRARREQEALDRVHRIPMWALFRHVHALVLMFALSWWAGFACIRKLD